MTQLTRTVRNYTITALLASTATLVVLRALEQLDWNWFLIFAPLWVPLVLAVVVGMALGTGRGLDALIEQPYQHRADESSGVDQIEQMLDESVASPAPEPFVNQAVLDDNTIGYEQAPPIVVEESTFESVEPVEKDIIVEEVITTEDLEPTVDETSTPVDSVEETDVIEPVEDASELLYARRGSWEAYASKAEGGKVVLLQVRNLTPETVGKVSVTVRAVHEELKLQANPDGSWFGSFGPLAPTVALSAVAGRTVPNIWQPYEGEIPQPDTSM